MLSSQQQQILLKLARQAIATFLRQQRQIDPAPTLPAPLLAKKEFGIFVSLHLGPQLRGCIGTMLTKDSLAQATIEMSLAASQRDPRFNPLKISELSPLEIEISLLSKTIAIDHPSQIIIGEHGLEIDFKGKRGVLLPQVATKFNWDREQFLENICLKAGLERDDWKDPKAKLFYFSAQVFSENKKELAG